MSFLPRSQASAESSADIYAPCEFLSWDSQFFARRIASVKESRLSRATVLEILEWCKGQEIDCLYFLADFGDPQTIRLAEEHRFHLVDIRLTLSMRLTKPPGPVLRSSRIRPSRTPDVPVLRSIARINHQDSRFYFDVGFPRERCDALYDTWIEKSCQGFADVVFVPELDGRAAGYISCNLKPDGTGQIGLLGLAPEARGMGLGTELVQTALRWFFSKGVEQVRVVTQGRNVSAQRLYQRCGFATHELRLWYHRWFLPEEWNQRLVLHAKWAKKKGNG